MKDHDSRRCWISGEGLSYRDQIREKKTQRNLQVGFNRLEARKKDHTI
jgi:hypothetical protein